MTELYFLDENFCLMEGPVEDMTSVVWSERYYEPGVFSFHFPLALAKRLSGAVYVRSGKNSMGEVFCGRIEYLRTDGDGNCEMGGHFLECLLDDRMLSPMTKSGRISEILRSTAGDILADSPVNPGEFDRLDGEESSLTTRWEPLGDWMRSVLRPFGAACRVTLDGNDVPVLDIVRGRNLTSDGGSQPVIFSASYGNIFSVETERDSAAMKNAVYVEGKDGTVVFLDLSGAGDRREMYKKAAEINPDEYASDAEYRSALLRRGGEILAGQGASLKVRAEIDGESLPVYGTDYRLGDLCDVVDEELGLSLALRLIRVDWVAENGSTAVYPVFELE